MKIIIITTHENYNLSYFSTQKNLFREEEEFPMLNFQLGIFISRLKQSRSKFDSMVQYTSP